MLFESKKILDKFLTDNKIYKCYYHNLEHNNISPYILSNICDQYPEYLLMIPTPIDNENIDWKLLSDKWSNLINDHSFILSLIVNFSWGKRLIRFLKENDVYSQFKNGISLYTLTHVDSPNEIIKSLIWFSKTKQETNLWNNLNDKWSKVYKNEYE